MFLCFNVLLTVDLSVPPHLLSVILLQLDGGWTRGLLPSLIARQEDACARPSED